jgi:hypothetical protein
MPMLKGDLKTEDIKRYVTKDLLALHATNFMSEHKSVQHLQIII